MFGRVLDTSVEDTVWLNGYQLFTVVVIWCKDWFNSYRLHMVANIIRYLTRIKKDLEIKKRCRYSFVIKWNWRLVKTWKCFYYINVRMLKLLETLIWTIESAVSDTSKTKSNLPWIVFLKKDCGCRVLISYG